MELILATENDLDILAEMNYQLIRDEGHRNSMSIAQLKERMFGWLKGEYQVVLIEENKNKVGYTLWRREADFIYVRQFYISPVFRRKGFGRSAIEALKTSHWLGNRLRLEVLVNNFRALAFWRSVGFTEYCITFECENTHETK